ncbi:MAG: transposase, partial [Caulobacteraceae bacterium]
REWVVYAKRPFAGPEAVLAYLARYTHRVAISSSRLVRLDARSVTFRYKDYRRDGPERQKCMTLDAAEFIRRFLIHVLPQGFHRIRHFGLFANTGRAANLAKLRALLKPQSARPAVEAANDNAAIVDAFPCPCCGGRMRLIEVFERGAQPRLAARFTARGIDSS